jgi:hypothetical protein
MRIAWGLPRLQCRDMQPDQATAPLLGACRGAFSGPADFVHAHRKGQAATCDHAVLHAFEPAALAISACNLIKPADSITGLPC